MSASATQGMTSHHCALRPTIWISMRIMSPAMMLPIPTNPDTVCTIATVVSVENCLSIQGKIAKESSHPQRRKMRPMRWKVIIMSFSARLVTRIGMIRGRNQVHLQMLSVHIFTVCVSLATLRKLRKSFPALQDTSERVPKKIQAM